MTTHDHSGSTRGDHAADDDNVARDRDASTAVPPLRPPVIGRTLTALGGIIAAIGGALLLVGLVIALVRVVFTYEPLVAVGLAVLLGGAVLAGVGEIVRSTVVTGDGDR